MVLIGFQIPYEEIIIIKGIPELRTESHALLVFCHVSALGIELHEVSIRFAHTFVERHLVHVHLMLEHTVEVGCFLVVGGDVFAGMHLAVLEEVRPEGGYVPTEHCTEE